MSIRRFAQILGLCGLCLLAFSQGVNGINNGLGRVPQMGWNSWYDLMCTQAMNETTVIASADRLIELGLAHLGYNYINLDDCWSAGRFANGTQYSQPDTFPSGIAALASAIHERGLMFGVYTDRGNATCAGRPGALGYEKIDASTYAEWGVDYLKEDSCNASQDHQTAFDEYATMRDALNATGRPIFFSLCGWYPWYAPEGYSLGNSWRTGQDDTTWDGVLADIDTMAENHLEQYAKPGGINDPCMLLSADYTGLRAMTEMQTRAQFSQWAIMASPLLISGSLLQMTAETLATYSNTEVIAIDQDPLVEQGFMLTSVPAATSLQNGSAQVWGRRLSNGQYALHFLNAGNTTLNLTCDPSCYSTLLPSGSSVFELYDLWLHQSLVGFEFGEIITIEDLPANGGSRMFRLDPPSSAATSYVNEMKKVHIDMKKDPLIQGNVVVHGPIGSSIALE